MGMLALTSNPSLKACAWPLRITSVRISAAGSITDATRSDHWLSMLAKPFAAFGYNLLHDVPLPWVKCLQGVHHMPEGVPVNYATSSIGRQETIHLGLLHESYLRGAQSLHTSTELLVGPNGLVTRTGATLTQRLPTAFQTLRTALPNGSVLTLEEESQTWSSRIRDAERMQSTCWLCRTVMRDGSICIRCKDGRNWSFLLWRR